jgi:hypothetical protein
VAPFFVIILVGLVDMGRLVWLRMTIETAVAAASNYALVNQSLVGSASGATLAASLGAVMQANLGVTLTGGTAVVNNGPTVTITNGIAANSGTAANADSCYCPTGTSSPWIWGSTATCGSSCASGLTAGKFVAITETQTFVPIFSLYNLVANNQVTAGAMVQVQ